MLGNWMVLKTLHKLQNSADEYWETLFTKKSLSKDEKKLKHLMRKAHLSEAPAQGSPDSGGSLAKAGVSAHWRSSWTKVVQVILRSNN